MHFSFTKVCGIDARRGMKNLAVLPNFAKPPPNPPNPPNPSPNGAQVNTTSRLKILANVLTFKQYDQMRYTSLSAQYCKLLSIWVLCRKHYDLSLFAVIFPLIFINCVQCCFANRHRLIYLAHVHLVILSEYLKYKYVVLCFIAFCVTYEAIIRLQ